MSAIVHGKPAARADATAFPMFQSLPAMIAVAFAAVIAAGGSIAVDVWRDGGFLDTDDAMRMVEVRDYLAGQGWFDLTAYRLDPPHGATMHWSRIIDAPLAVLVRAFGLTVDQVAAERIMRLVWPWALHLALIVSVITTARRLMGTAATGPAAFLAALTIATSGQFIPGRIDHHNVEIVAMLLMLRASIEALSREKRSAGAAALAAALGIAALAVSLEDLPFVAAMMASFGLLWIREGSRMQRVLFAFGLSLATAGALAFAATVPPADYGQAYCDNYTIPHAVAVSLGGVLLALVAALSARLDHWGTRLAAAALAGGATLVAVAVFFPACLGEPLVAVDPLVRELWLNNVNESRNLFRALHEQPALFTGLAVPLVAGALALLLAFVKTPMDKRAAWLPVVMFMSVGFACALWQVRMLAPAAILTAFGGIWAVTRVASASFRERAHQYGAVAVVFLLVCPAAWVMALERLPKAGAKAEDEGTKACLAPKAFASLRNLEPGLVLAPIDLGAHILAFTPHSVLGAPYHRNNDGNRATIEAMLGSPESAQKIARERHVSYVVTCAELSELATYDGRAPNGFSAALKRGEVPSWLEPLPHEGSLSVFRLRESH